MFHSAFSSSLAVTEEEEETRKIFLTGLTLPDKNRQTLELKPDSKKKEKPVFLSQLSPTAAHVGETAVFTVKVLSFPKPFVQWFHEGQVITSSSVHMFLHKQDEYSLVIKQVQRESEGQYSCTFRNRFGQCSCTSYLQVQPERADKDTVPTGKAPEFIKRIESVQVSEGGSACLRYQVCGEPQPHIEWLHGSVCLQPSDLCEVVNNLDGSGFIHIKVVKQEHSGTYTCRASNLHGEDSCSSQLLVIRHEQLQLRKSDSLKISMTEQSSEWTHWVKSGRDQADTIIIPSEETQTLRELDISAATLRRELLTYQAAVEQSQEIEERVSAGPVHPPKVCATPKTHLHTATLVSSVQENPQITDQRLKRLLSPEVVEPQLAKEPPSKLRAATSQQQLPLATVSAQMLAGVSPDHTKSSAEPRPCVVAPQVQLAPPMSHETSCVVYRPEEERGFNVEEGTRILYSAQFSEQQPITERHSEPLPDFGAAFTPCVKKEQDNEVVAPVGQSPLVLAKEQSLGLQTPESETITADKDRVHMFAVAAEETYALQAGHVEHVPSMESSVSLHSEQEQQPVLNLQVFTNLEVLQSEENLNYVEPTSEQAEVRSSRTLLHSTTKDDRRTVVCEATSQLISERNSLSVRPKTEMLHPKHLQCVSSVQVLPKEGILDLSKPDQQVVTQKQEKVRRHAAMSEERRKITAGFHTDLDTTVSRLQVQKGIESRPPSISAVSMQPMGFLKEEPLTASVKPQRALVQTEDQWDKMQSLNVTDLQTLQGDHTSNIKADSICKTQLKIESKVPRKTVLVEQKALTTETCTALETAEQDSVSGMEEEHLVRQSVLLEEKRVITEEQAIEIPKFKVLPVSVLAPPRQVLFVHKSEDTQVLPKELHFSIHIPQPSVLEIRHQLRDALHSAVSQDQSLLLIEAVGHLDTVEVQEVTPQREPRRPKHTYLITTPKALIEITLSFDAKLPQTADLRSELQAALQAMVFQDQKCLTSEHRVTFPTENLCKAQVSLAASKDTWSSVVEDVVVAESAVRIPPTVRQSAEYKTEATASAQSAIVQSQSVQLKSARKVCGASAKEQVDISVEVKTIMSETLDSLVDYPTVIDSLYDIYAEENSKVVLTTTIKYVTSVEWFFNGQLIRSGKEFKCSKDCDTYSLVIAKVVKDRHQGEFVCEAKNEVGRTTTSSKVTVVSRGLMMDPLISSSTN